MSHTSDGEDYFVAKNGNKTLWKEFAMGALMHDQQSGVFVLVSQAILVVDRSGAVKNTLEYESADPHAPSP